MRFELNAEQISKLKAWNADQDRSVVQQQRDSGDPFVRMLNADEQPYYGAIGGALTFTFTPTSIGTLVSVKHSGTGAVLDLSDEGGFG
jgi:hypothetical protein